MSPQSVGIIRGSLPCLPAWSSAALTVLFRDFRLMFQSRCHYNWLNLIWVDVTDHNHAWGSLLMQKIHRAVDLNCQNALLEDHRLPCMRGIEILLSVKRRLQQGYCSEGSYGEPCKPNYQSYCHYMLCTAKLSTVDLAHARQRSLNWPLG